MTFTSDPTAGMDALELLANDHRAAQRDISRYHLATTHREQRDLVYTVVDELHRHTIVEEHMLYPLLARLANPVDLLPSPQLDVHDEMHLVLAALPQTVHHDRGATDDLMATLHLDLTLHTDFDEEHLHPQLRHALDQPARDELGRLLQEAKGIIAGPTDSGVSADRTTNLAIAIATYCDRLRDRLGDGAPL
jgi:hypothetical protein